MNARLGGPRPFHFNTYDKPGATIVRVTFENPINNYYIKIKRPQTCLNPNGASIVDGLQREYIHLRMLHEIGLRGISLPRPLLLDLGALILVTSEVPGQSVLRKYSQLARIFPRDQRHLAYDLPQIGRALDILHRSDIPAHAVHPAQYADQFRKNISDPILALPPRLLDSLHDFAHRIEDRISQLRPVRTCHNDFATHNILISERGVGVVDFESLAINSPHRDFSTLYVSLNDFLVFAPSRRIRLAKLWSSFCIGYGQPISLDQMRPFLIHHLVNHLLDLTVRRDTTTSFAARFFFSQLIRLNFGLVTDLLPND